MKTKVIYAFHIFLVVAAAWGLGFSVAKGQEGTLPAPQAPEVAATGFTYQGSLKQAGSAVNSTCDFKFGLWNAQSLGTQLGVTQTLTSTVSGGLFSVKLNGSSQFSATPFDGNPRWLATAVRCPAGSGSYTSLTPQELNAAPYALSAPWSGISGKPSNTVIVAKSGGDYNTITAALNSISAASDINRYLVKVMPGVYTETVTMKQYVDIEGSGELATKITYTGNAGIYGTVRGANNAELRFLTVESKGGGANYAVAISNYATSPRLTHITASASGATDNLSVYSNASSPVMTNVTASASGGTNCHGVYNVSGSPVMTNISASGTGGTFARGVYNSASSPVMTNVTASASGGTTLNIGIDITSSSSPTMTNVIASASGGASTRAVNIASSSPAIQDSVLRASGGTNNYGIYNSASSGAYTVKFNHSQVTGSTNTIFNDSHFTMQIGATLLEGGVALANGGTLTCAGVYDEAFVFYASTCP